MGVEKQSAALSALVLVQSDADDAGCSHLPHLWRQNLCHHLTRIIRTHIWTHRKFILQVCVCVVHYCLYAPFVLVQNTPLKCKHHPDDQWAWFVFHFSHRSVPSYIPSIHLFTVVYKQSVYFIYLFVHHLLSTLLQHSCLCPLECSQVNTPEAAYITLGLALWLNLSFYRSWKYLTSETLPLLEKLYSCDQAMTDQEFILDLCLQYSDWMKLGWALIVFINVNFLLCFRKGWCLTLTTKGASITGMFYPIQVDLWACERRIHCLHIRSCRLYAFIISSHCFKSFRRMESFWWRFSRVVQLLLIIRTKFTHSLWIPAFC